MLIKTEQDYKKALERLDALFDAPIGTPEGKEADKLAADIERYEQVHYPIGS